jgi:hypothetical protein
MSRKEIKIAVLILVTWIGCLPGCVDSADIELGTASAQLVVEGKIEAGEPPYILLSKSGGFYAKQPVFVEDADVAISDDRGITIQLNYEGDGKYVTTEMVGEVGRRYHLKILHQGKGYEAWATIPSLPEIESIDVEYFNQSVLREEGYYIQLKGEDNSLEPGYYRVLVYNDDILINPLGTNDFFVAIADDAEVKKIEVPIPFEAGDKLRLEVLRIDKSAYAFYQSYLLLLLNDGGLFGSPPSNPESNISNEALGLFQALSKLEVEVEIE